MKNSVKLSNTWCVLGIRLYVTITALSTSFLVINSEQKMLKVGYGRTHLWLQMYSSEFLITSCRPSFLNKAIRVRPTKDLRYQIIALSAK